MLKSNRIFRKKLQRKCIQCGKPIEHAAKTIQDPGYHLECYIQYVRQLKEKHGETTCFFCIHFGILNGMGGKGSCPYRKKLVGASKGICAKFESKLVQLQALMLNEQLISKGKLHENK